MKEETRNIIPFEVSEISVPETHFDRKLHTHHMVTRQTAQAIETPDFFCKTNSNATRTIITPTSKFVNTLITKQQFTNG